MTELQGTEIITLLTTLSTNLSTVMTNQETILSIINSIKFYLGFILGVQVCLFFRK